MSIITKIVGHISPLIEAVIWYRIMTSMLNKKYTRKYYITAAAFIAILLIMKTYVFSVPALSHMRVIGSIVTITYTFFAGILLFENAFLEKIIWWGIYYIDLFFIEIIAIFIIPILSDVTLQELQTDGILNTWVAFSTKLVSLFAFEIFVKIRKGKLQINYYSYKNLRFLILFNIMLFLGCVIIYFNLYNSKVNVETVVFIFFGIVLLMTLVTFNLVLRIEKESKKEIETKLKLAQIEMEMKQNNDMIHVTENLRKLRHDMNNHIGLIRNLVYMEQYRDLKKYVDQLYGDVEKANDFIISENKTLTVLLNAKRNKAKELDIEFQSVVAAAEIKMQDKDICALFGNILDNAIEAAVHAAGQKFVDFSIQNINNKCVIRCENSFGKKPILRKGKFISIKDNASLHGIGTENIKDIVAKYNGEVRFEFDEGIFNIRVVMPI